MNSKREQIEQLSATLLSLYEDYRKVERFWKNRTPEQEAYCLAINEHIMSLEFLVGRLLRTNVEETA